MIPLHDDNPAHKPAFISIALIVLCTVIFLWQQSLDPRAQQQVVYALGAIPAVIFGSMPLHPELQLLPSEMTLFSSMFLHGGWMHLIGNMLYLWIFADNVEAAMGHLRFVFFYIICGLVAVLAHALPNIDSNIPMIGASGAISGVLGAYVLLYPHARILVLVPLGFYITTMRLSAGIVLALWFALQLISSALSDPNSPGVAWGAHIGGFIAGLALIPLFKHKSVPLLAPARRKTKS